jgi:hypothetical protein
MRSGIRIRIKVKSRIRIRIRVKRGTVIRTPQRDVDTQLYLSENNLST